MGVNICIGHSKPTHMTTTQRPPQSTLLAPAPRLRVRLSARQLFDVELGLCLLNQLWPAAPPQGLPGLLSGNVPAAVGPTWTAKQRRLLNRGRVLLLPFQQSSCWNTLLECYCRLDQQALAFDISNDRSRFGPKKVGFSRNRVFALQQLLA